MSRLRPSAVPARTARGRGSVRSRGGRSAARQQRVLGAVGAPWRVACRRPGLRRDGRCGGGARFPSSADPVEAPASRRRDEVGIRVVAGDPVRPPVADRRRELRLELGGIAASREPERELTDHEVVAVPALARRGEERRGPLDRSIQRRDDLAPPGSPATGRYWLSRRPRPIGSRPASASASASSARRSRIRVAESLAPGLPRGRLSGLYDRPLRREEGVRRRYPRVGPGPARRPRRAAGPGRRR